MALVVGFGMDYSAPAAHPILYCSHRGSGGDRCTRGVVAHGSGGPVVHVVGITILGPEGEWGACLADQVGSNDIYKLP